MQLWETGTTDARILATMMMDSNKLSKQEIADMVQSITYSTLIDELVYNVIMNTSFADELGSQWLDSPEEFVGRTGWNIQEAEMKLAPLRKQGSMNRCLVEIGVRIPVYTRCIIIGEQIGRLDNKPVHKGCTSSYAPEWDCCGSS
ncbi:DNA alkylation repair protein [Paenibacillus glacialis]|uniref:Uncharacterized protein n=1 Tax=Paenibacillus glacialis TaxID=494026 RepID=A0A162LYA6_9BACL|nr:DNA alkylation repair protein [Paenibacillus glacialis]OAB41747.1 hypothetical protein PGLA_15880 [Paenibacillus glacialis]